MTLSPHQDSHQDAEQLYNDHQEISIWNRRSTNEVAKKKESDQKQQLPKGEQGQSQGFRAKSFAQKLYHARQFCFGTMPDLHLMIEHNGFLKSQNAPG